jgi:hypothetical protein
VNRRVLLGGGDETILSTSRQALIRWLHQPREIPHDQAQTIEGKPGVSC